MEKMLQPPNRIIGVGFVLLAIGCASAQVSESPETRGPDGKADLFGADDRTEVFEFVAGSTARMVAQATAAMFRDYDLERNPDGLWLPIEPLETLAERNDLCVEEPYGNQPSVSICTAFLVADDLVLTAGHCARLRHCDYLSFAFDFEYANESEVGSFPVITDDNYYRCAETIEKHTQSCEDDWALIRLDRPTGRTPLAYRREGEPALDTPLIAVGYPQGVPAKVATQGRIRGIDALKLHTDLDLFGGNSGSPVVDASTGTIEGIHVCSEPGNFMWAPDGRRCKVALQCGADAEHCDRWSEATRISRLSAVIDAARGIQDEPPNDCEGTYYDDARVCRSESGAFANEACCETQCFDAYRDSAGRCRRGDAKFAPAFCCD